MTFTNTSKEALASVRPYVPGMRDQIWNFISNMQKNGATCDEVEQMYCMRHQTASARIRELFLAGKIVDSGERRATRSGRSAVVWKSKEAA